VRVGNGIRIATLLASITALLGFAPGVAAAEVFKVSTTQDGDDKECLKTCTLREAVSLAGLGDQVDVPAGTYLLTDGELFLTSDTIVGAGARSTIIDGGAKSRALWVTDGTTNVSGLTIWRGNGVGRAPSGVGGGIFVQSGLLNLIDSTVMTNTASTGGGIASTGNVNVVGSTVSGNKATDEKLAQGGGIAVASSGELALGNSTVSNNTATAADSEGGGVHSAGALTVINSTFWKNHAASGGGLFVISPRLGAPSVNNTVLEAGTGGACGGPGLGAITAHHNVVSDDSCQFKGEGNLQAVDPKLAGLDDYGGPTRTHALLPTSPAINAGSGCAQTDQRGVPRPQPAGGLCDVGAFEYRAPKLAIVTDVVNDDGGTITADQLTVHVLLNKQEVKGSPRQGSVTYTLDAFQSYQVAAPLSGYSVALGGGCPPNGIVGLWEGESKTCTVTADDQPANLRLTTTVVNDNGGTRTAGQFFVRVREGITDVASGTGSEAGTSYSLDAGSYVVSADAVDGYTFTLSGDCTSAGAITLAVGDSRSCTITATDDPPPATISQAQQQPQEETQQLPPPKGGETANALPKSGTVKIKLPGTKTFVELKEGQQIPLGTVIDVRNGRITIIAAADKSGGTATADFYGGIFELGQTKGAKPITTLELTEKLSCPTSGKASIAAKRKKKRRLWGDGSGKFRTEGQYSSATVRGTKWLVEDRCGSTLTKVVRGKVAVRDFAKRKTVIVKAGKKYVARRRR
jgi:CSLREA domain-containing protein